jgi:beta-galactosidase
MLATESYQADTFAVWAVAEEHPYFIGDIVWTGWDYLGESGIGRGDEVTVVPVGN